MAANKQNSNPDNDVPFDHDLDEFDNEFVDREPEHITETYEEPETLDDVRGESELAHTKKVRAKGQKALLFSLFFLAALVASGMVYKITRTNEKMNTETEKEVATNFQKPADRNFGEQFEDVQYYNPASGTASTPMPTEVTTNEPIAINTRGVSGNYPPSTVEPPPSYSSGQVSQVNAPEPTPTPTPVPEPVQPTIAPPVAEVPLSPEEERQMRIYKSGFNTPRSATAASGSDNVTVGNSNQRRGGGGDRLTASLTPATLEGSSASRLKNRDLIITKGSMIDCVLNTKFDSSVVGMVTCTVTRNIYSASGRVVLIDRGSKVTGEYQGGLQQGQNRVFILWNRIETPKGVIVDINSPSAGSLGEAGANGRIDSKFWKRFGGAMLVSVINDLGKAASEALAEKSVGGNVDFEDSSNTAQQMATAELEKSINIPPSMIKHQGDRLNIFVARDVYFGGVYDLKSK